VLCGKERSLIADYRAKFAGDRILAARTARAAPTTRVAR
jgi:hypothetical protein